ncbi:MAG: DUF72 domain-containing protein [Candidatus Latescibacterota bacterium]
MIAIGTSGFSFKDWKGVFYPEEIKPKEMLAYYKDIFRAVEINTTYYGIPKPGVFEGMIRATPPDFEFIVKANRSTTHELKDRDVSGTFIESIRPLGESGRLSGILAQFPWQFRNDAGNRRYIACLADTYRKFHLFVEFRHNSWNRDEVFRFLDDLKIHFVSVDEPQIGDMMPPVARATGGAAYIRFHGRNAQNWWSKSADRYNYLYSEEEMEEWVEKVKALEKTVWKLYAFFNNCHQGYAVRNALMFKEMVERKKRLPESR